MEALSMYLKQPNFIYLCAYIWLATLTVATAGADPIRPESDSKTEGPVIVGGRGGDEFSFKSTLTNSFQKMIITYNEEWHFFSPNEVRSLNTIQVTFQNGQMIKVGSVAGNKETVFTFDETDRIVSATLWPNGYHNRFGGIKFVVEKNDGKRIKMSVKCEEVGEPVTVNVRSGKCYGVEGRSGHEIDALGFYFI